MPLILYDLGNAPERVVEEAGVRQISSRGGRVAWER